MMNIKMCRKCGCEIQEFERCCKCRLAISTICNCCANIVLTQTHTHRNRSGRKVRNVM